MSSQQTIRVERAFYHDRVVQPVGAVIEVPKHIAAGLIASRKASAYQSPAPAAPPDEPTPAAVTADPAPTKPRGKRNAG